jgi:hypothetical protein
MTAAAQTLFASRRARDHYLYVFMAALFFVIAVAGFGPRSRAILNGVIPVPPLVVHIHAALMTAWLLLLLAQASLKATSHLQWHRNLGLASFVLGPAIFIAMLAVTYIRYHDMTAAGLGDLGSSILLLQIRGAILFPIFFIWAIRTRKSDAETHKRMMLMTTLVILDAAIARMSWLPGNAMPVSYDMVHGYLLLVITPALIFDKINYGRVHRAYIIGLALLVPFIVITSFLWASPWWLETAPKLMGV